MNVRVIEECLYINIFCSSQQFLREVKNPKKKFYPFLSPQFLVKSGQTCNPLLSVNDLLEVLLLLCMPRSTKRRPGCRGCCCLWKRSNNILLRVLIAFVFLQWILFSTSNFFSYLIHFVWVTRYKNINSTKI